MTTMPRTITTLQIRGMNAVHAVRAIETALGGLDGVARAEVSLGTARVEHDERVTIAMLVAAVKMAGFDVDHWSQTTRTLPTL